jgi:hypothetical protein
MASDTKRANFDLSPEQDELLTNLRSLLSVSSTKDAVLRAVQVTTLLTHEIRRGNQLFIGKNPTAAMRLVIPELEGRAETEWQWLVERPHPWRRQLWIKGRKLLASSVWLDALTNGLGPHEAAEHWDLPLAACEEVFAYCEAHQNLIKAEADEERQRLKLAGIDVDSRVAV